MDTKTKQITARLQEALKANQLSIRKIAENETQEKKLQRQLRGENAMTLEVLLHILEKMTNLSMEWLFRGTGTMNNTGTINADNNQGQIVQNSKDVNIGSIDTLTSQLAEKDKQISRLLQLLDKK